MKRHLQCASNKRQPPTSANTAPARQNEPHDWSASHMKRHLQCAEQQASPSNFTKYWPATQNESHDWSISHMKRHLQCAEQQSTPFNLTKYCACHAKWISWLIHITYETSFTMRGATGITLQPHQILRLPRIMNVMIEAHHRWNVIYNARSNRQHPPTSPNMRLPRKWISWLIHITYETSFTMRGATGITLQPHQILRLPRKMSLMIDPYHIIMRFILRGRRSIWWGWRVLTVAPRIVNDVSYVIWIMKRHFQCAEQQASISNLTKYCAYHAKLHSQILEKLTENSWSGISNARPIDHDPTRSDHDPRMIRPRKRKPQTRRAAKATFRTGRQQILLKITTFPAPAIIPNFTTCCACHKKWHMNFTKCCACHRKWHMNFTKCCTCHKKVTHELHQMLHLPRKVTHELHQMLHLPWKVTRSDTWLLLLLLGLPLLGLPLLGLPLLGLPLLGYYYY